MPKDFSNEPMLEMYIFETSQMIEQLERILISSEEEGSFDSEAINEIFRIMHTIKGSSAMMLYNAIAALAHAVEDMFFFIREEKPQSMDYSQITDLVFEALDYIKLELIKIKDGNKADGDSTALIATIENYLQSLKGQDKVGNESKNSVFVPGADQQQYYISKNKDVEPNLKNCFQACLFFEDDCGMENLRAFAVLNDLEGSVEEYYSEPADLDQEGVPELIRDNGFKLFVRTQKTEQEIRGLLENTIFLKKLELSPMPESETFVSPLIRELGITVEDNSCQSKMTRPEEAKDQSEKESSTGLGHQSIINVSVAKLDILMDLVGEMVIAESMVTQNPDLKGLDLQNFQKAARQLNKITTELQDIVMSVRMVPLLATFQKMNRTVRDMCKKLGKEVKLKLVGEETEVDKNIIEHISDPLMHLIRNSIDHGIEMPDIREAKGKPRYGTVTLEGKNAGSDVLVIVRDDGEGFNKERILEKAQKNGLLQKPVQEMTDKEIYNLVFLPGFSTNEAVTEFSGRGVGMDVVIKNIEAVGGSVSAECIPGQGTTLTLKIPLTLAIIDGMNLKVGDSRFTLPIISIKESFRPLASDLIVDPNNQEMLMVRGQCYPVLRLHSFYKIQTDVLQLIDGIIIMVEHGGRNLCIFADELLGKQQVVVKSLPNYIKKVRSIPSLAGCTLLGDGSISLILDIGGLIADKG